MDLRRNKKTLTQRRARKAKTQRIFLASLLCVRFFTWGFALSSYPLKTARHECVCRHFWSGCLKNGTPWVWLLPILDQDASKTARHECVCRHFWWWCLMMSFVLKEVSVRPKVGTWWRRNENFWLFSPRVPLWKRDEIRSAKLFRWGEGYY